MSAIRYAKRPVEVEAMEWNGENTDAVLAWINQTGTRVAVHVAADGEAKEHLAIETLEGVMRASVGDVVIRGVRGEHYPCKPDIFAETYKPAGDSTAEVLGQYHRELIDQGIPGDVADDLIRHAAMEHFHEKGIAVRAAPRG